MFSRYATSNLRASATTLRAKSVTTHVDVACGPAPFVDIKDENPARVELGHLVLEGGCASVLADDELDRPANNILGEERSSGGNSSWNF